MGVAAEAAHAASLDTEVRAALRAPLREDQLKRRETRLLERDSLCCPFGALAFAWSWQRRLRIQWAKALGGSTPPSRTKNLVLIREWPSKSPLRRSGAELSFGVRPSPPPSR